MDKLIEAGREAEMALLEAEGIKNIQEKYRCKITVLRLAFYAELYRQAPYGGAGPCGRLKAGQVLESIQNKVSFYA